MDFARQNIERTVQSTNWMRAIAEQNLNHSKAAFEGLLTVARNAVGNIDQQSSDGTFVPHDMKAHCPLPSIKRRTGSVPAGG